MDYPNEPAGTIVINETMHTQLGISGEWVKKPFAPTPDGWFDQYDGHTSYIVNDPREPLSPGSAIEQKFMAGQRGGDFGAGGSRVRFAQPFNTPIVWTFSFQVVPNFQNHPVFTKIAWIHTAYGPGSRDEQNQFFMGVVGNGPYRINANYQNNDTDNTAFGGDKPLGTVRFDPNGFGDFNAGDWVVIQWLVKPSRTPTSRDGHCVVYVHNKWPTVNGNPVINARGINTQNLYFTGVSHVTIWGGTGGVTDRDSFLRFGHSRVVTLGGNVDTQAPAAVANVTVEGPQP